jgi:DNA repair protein RecO (recombination protein O)
MPRYQGPAFVLKKWDLGESDQLVSFLSFSRGKLKGVAKGAKRSKKRFGGLLSPFLLVEVDCFENPNRDLVRIEGCSLIHYYASIYGDLEKLLVGCCALEFLERVLPERGSQEDWFQLLQHSLDCLNQRAGAGPLLWVFLAKALHLLGLQPQFVQCIHCRRRLGKAGVFGFSVPHGGVVCGACIQKGTATHRAASDTLRLLDRWATLPVDKGVSTADGGNRRVREAARLLEAFLAYHVGRELKSLRVMREVLADRRKGKGEREKGRT